MTYSGRSTSSASSWSIHVSSTPIGGMTSHSARVGALYPVRSRMSRRWRRGRKRPFASPIKLFTVAVTHYVRVDDDGNPMRLLRGRAGPVDVWNGSEWVSTSLFQPQLDGLGGASDYRRLRDEDVAEWQATLS